MGNICDVQNSLMSCLNPVLESNKPTFLTSLLLTKVEMGDSPPVLGGVKFLSGDPTSPCQELSFDAEVRFIASETQIAELKMISHVGAAARIRLKDAFLMGTLRITLKPMCTIWPGFRYFDADIPEIAYIDLIVIYLAAFQYHLLGQAVH